MAWQDRSASEKDGHTASEYQRIASVYKKYDIGWLDRDKLKLGRRAMDAERDAKLHSLITAHLIGRLEDAVIMDLGCGFGEQTQWLCEIGATPRNIYGVDLLPERIDRAQKRYPDRNFLCCDAHSIDLPRKCDIIFAMTVFSSILNKSVALSTSEKIQSMLNRSGFICWYDIRYPSPYNPDVRAMTKRRIRTLFRSCHVDIEPITVIAPLSRRLGSLTDSLYPFLSSIPVLRSHNIGVIKPMFHSI
ncbi:class I SAM-dependent methyltransferase [Methylobacterium iners]|uniref:Trans-aconitate 2-methyltransferase n=1 Tax=Methylobacterium iners TaxID=418707 RepID=A0ABQ4RWD3_9HYPH|nr:class I SAM-dependent methyltransferase [Methylobacterium iners]GJD94498.1 Trans-aconitate 2-methyltransferase [Methylobacterium iners]